MAIATIPSQRELAERIKRIAGQREIEILQHDDLRCYITRAYPGCIELSSNKLGRMFLYRIETDSIVG